MDSKAWIFVSHASADLDQVRRVRNYLEARCGSPLLFNLRALTEPEEFWPLIKREIEARHFFLYCDSKAAEDSPWVRREREAVRNSDRPKRIGAVRVDDGELDYSSLDDFIRKTKVFLNYAAHDEARVAPFYAALKGAGFTILNDEQALAFDLCERVDQILSAAAAEGWVVSFFTRQSLQTPSALAEIAMGKTLGAQFAPVFLEPVDAPELAGTDPFLAFIDPNASPLALAHLLLARA